MERVETSVYRMTWEAVGQTERFVSSCGGTRSGKTIAILQLLNKMCLMDRRPRVTSVVSETIPHLKRGCIRDYQTIVMGDDFDEKRWNKTDLIYTYPNGSILEFFSLDNIGKVHGTARDRLFMNECQYSSYDIARQLFVRTKGLIICDYNPTHTFWINTEIEPRDNCVTIHSTYKDNECLSDLQIAEIESNRGDRNWWRIYGEGLVGVLEGLIYDFEQIDSLPYGDEATRLKECYGMDFGFTNDPTTLVHILADTGRKIIYADEVCYQTRMMNTDIARMMAENRVDRRCEVFADCAEPKSIAEIATAGFNIVPCDKDAPVRSDKLKFQLQWMQGWTLKVTKRSLNLIKELRNYTWAKDRDGNTINQPIDKFNHALDALRYGVWTKFGRDYGRGNYIVH